MVHKLTFLASIPTADGLASRSAYVIGTKTALSNDGAYTAVKNAISPKGEVSQEIYTCSVQALEEGDKGDTVPMHGKDAAVMCISQKCSRNNCPARPDTVKALLKSHVGRKKDCIVVLLCDKQYIMALSAAIARCCPPLFNMKSSVNPAENFSMAVVAIAVGPSGAEALSENDVKALNAMATGIHLTQRLVDSPTNVLNTDAMLKEAAAVAGMPATNGTVKMETIRGEELRDRGMGGLWNVGMAAPAPPALVILTYEPSGAGADTKTVCWVGKGIVYDTGGLSMKGKFDMPTMKRDMGGSAAILGAFQAAVSIGVGYRLHALLCLAENSVDSVAMRPDDIITMMSGKTVEVNNTDAEGRLVLADGVFYAATQLKPSMILDMATLTGAQRGATGKKHAALLCNDVDAEQTFFKAGLATGDLVYPIIYCPELFMPQAFTSEVADMKNSADDRGNALASCAGHFIEANLPSDYAGQWVHIDMATPVAEEQRATGWGVALLLKAGGILDL